LLIEIRGESVDTTEYVGGPVGTRRSVGFSKKDLLIKVAACERALGLVTNPEHQDVLRHLQKLWKELAQERPAVLEAHFADEIMLLSELQTEISKAAVH
jgi:hypothetical protein